MSQRQCRRVDAALCVVSLRLAHGELGGGACGLDAVRAAVVASRHALRCGELRIARHQLAQREGEHHRVVGVERAEHHEDRGPQAPCCPDIGEMALPVALLATQPAHECQHGRRNRANNAGDSQQRQRQAAGRDAHEEPLEEPRRSLAREAARRLLHGLDDAGGEEQHAPVARPAGHGHARGAHRQRGHQIEGAQRVVQQTGGEEGHHADAERLHGLSDHPTAAAQLRSRARHLAALRRPPPLSQENRAGDGNDDDVDQRADTVDGQMHRLVGAVGEVHGDVAGGEVWRWRGVLHGDDA
ncbi:hypothetical protein SYNPS1DRAFT_30590 [Syncephalis pseudoplumigaleata]|uniref:Uncharacterized protein n=1 Tax=Syncephalis pseudoplumigaleata TaxID=1712513 RepID=A0A4P9YV41_9FUNG|nr:hypothetical protein SYNPS1DRAFT_30590 [Syncephalis pseudoplumigaleata]|eukprot:RKP23658.1 hypothetical protein SYNPS1DRAFT_30590 [Syncephalis pseudoplumigaleata]